MSVGPDDNTHDGYGKPGETNSGHNWLHSALRAAAVLVAVKNTETAWKIAKKQKDVADSYQRAAQQLRDNYYRTYAPYENEELKEVMAMKPYVKAYTTTAGRMVVDGLNGLKDAYRDAIVCAPRYCTGNVAASLTDLQMDTEKMLTAAKIQGARIEDAMYLTMEERRHSHINKALNRGRDILSTADSFGEVSAGIFGRLGGDAARGAAGAMKFLGYTFARGQRQDPMIGARVFERDDPTPAPSVVEPVIPQPRPARRPRILG